MHSLKSAWNEAQTERGWECAAQLYSQCHVRMLKNIRFRYMHVHPKVSSHGVKVSALSHPAFWWCLWYLFSLKRRSLIPRDCPKSWTLSPPFQICSARLFLSPPSLTHLLVVRKISHEASSRLLCMQNINKVNFVRGLGSWNYFWYVSRNLTWKARQNPPTSPVNVAIYIDGLRICGSLAVPVERQIIFSESGGTNVRGLTSRRAHVIGYIRRLQTCKVSVWSRKESAYCDDFVVERSKVGNNLSHGWFFVYDLAFVKVTVRCNQGRYTYERPCSQDGHGIDVAKKGRLHSCMSPPPSHKNSIVGSRKQGGRNQMLKNVKAGAMSKQSITSVLKPCRETDHGQMPVLCEHLFSDKNGAQGASLSIKNGVMRQLELSSWWPQHILCHVSIKMPSTTAYWHNMNNFDQKFPWRAWKTIGWWLQNSQGTCARP